MQISLKCNKIFHFMRLNLPNKQQCDASAPVTPLLRTYGDHYLSGLQSEQHPAAGELLNKRGAESTRLVLA